MCPFESGVCPAVTLSDPGEDLVVEVIAKCQTADLVVECTIVLQNVLFDQRYKRSVRIDLFTKSSKDTEVGDSLFECVGIVAKIKRAKLLQKSRVLATDGETLNDFVYYTKNSPFPILHNSFLIFHF